MQDVKLSDGEHAYVHIEKKILLAKNDIFSSWNASETISGSILRVLENDIKGVEKDNCLVFVREDLEDDTKIVETLCLSMDSWIWSISDTKYPMLLGLYANDMLTDVFLSVDYESIHKKFLEKTGFDRSSFVIKETNFIGYMPTFKMYDFLLNENPKLSWFDHEVHICNFNPDSVLIYGCEILPRTGSSEDRTFEFINKEFTLTLEEGRIHIKMGTESIYNYGATTSSFFKW